MSDLTSVYISLGSNIDPKVHLRNAFDELQQHFEQTVLSPVYQSPAVGMDGADFLNAVIGGLTRFSLEHTVSLLREIEAAHGRVRDSNKFSDRTLDLDLLMFGRRICKLDSSVSGICIELPHAEIREQAYVIQPLADIAPDLIHPVSGQTIEALCQQMKSDSAVKFNALKMVATI